MSLYGVMPTDEMVARELNIDEYLIDYALNSLKEPISIYTPIYNDNGDNIYLFDQIANKEAEYDKDTLIALSKAFKKLPKREQMIIYNRYFVGKTQTE